MALSNWDTLAIDLDGNPISGVFISPKSKAQIEIYKNWAYIHDSKVWHKGGNFINNVVAEIKSGSFTYQDIHIEAIRGPQNGTYIACWTVEYVKAKEKGQTEALYHGMIGCGVYGFKGEDWVGVTKESFDFLKNWISKKEPVWDSDEEIEFFVGGFKEAIKDRSKMPESPTRDMTVEQFRDDLKSQTRYVFDKEIATVDFSKAVRFCQGDMFFEDKLGIDKNATPVGQAEEPVLIQALKGEEEKTK